MLYDKSARLDDWSRGGTPDERWDSYSTSPFLSWPRFDLIDSSYAIAVLADLTPAWRELYVSLLDSFLARYVTWWGAVDWMTLEGADPERDAYPEEWRGTVVPAELFGDYNAPGWTGNGLEPWGHQPDPIGAEGNLFYKGFLSLILGLRARISGEDRRHEPFAVVPDADGGWVYSHQAVIETLESQWGARPEGCHCENTKIWPYCLSAAGLGLKLADATSGTTSHWVFDQWFDVAERNYLTRNADGRVVDSIFYTDPIAGVSMPGNPAANLGLSLYLTPQRGQVAHDLFDSVSGLVGWATDGVEVAHVPQEPRFASIGRVLAREFGDRAASERLDGLARDLEPTWTPEGGFYYGFGLEEAHPRGQPNATMMLAEAIDRPGRWAEAIGPVTDERFAEPTVRGVDYPTLGINQAAYDPTTSTLLVSTYAATPTDGATTTFAVTGLQEAAEWSVACDGVSHSRWRVVDRETVSVTCSVADHRFAITRGPR
ncbi:MAG TPA: hypothetical protein VMB91_10885 [Solirubrobacteraceae bacterium]|nr:hypothetical protein [Solirubrobacteraceae bacterium]